MYDHEIVVKDKLFHWFPEGFMCIECQFITKDDLCEKLGIHRGGTRYDPIMHYCRRNRPCYKKLSYQERLLEEQLGVYPK